jgi:hypothetical protein
MAEQSMQYIHICRNGEIMETTCAESLSPQTQSHSYQTVAFPMAIEATSNEQPQTSQRPNKYLYPVFDGFSGERYLDSILIQILPSALWRTWKYAVYFQAPGNLCYVGTAKIAERVKPGIRKIEIDLHELEVRGLMQKYPDRQEICREDGPPLIRAVVVKDFSNLYSLAYEYHLWTHSPEYIPPEREYADLIFADQQLCNKLIRFDNYRRVLCCAKPGRKPRQLEYSQANDQASVGQSAPEEIRTQGLNANNYLNTPANISSPYRVKEKDDNDRERRDSSPSTSEKGTEPVTIGNSQVEIHHKTEKIQSVGSENILPNSKPNTSPPPSAKRGAAEKEVKRVNGYTGEELKQDVKKRGAAAAGIPAEHYEKLSGGKDQTERQEECQRENQTREQRPQREIPAQIAKEITEYAQQYDDAHTIPSDVTRAAKIYFTAAQSIRFFQETLYWTCFDEAREAAKRLRGCEHTNTKGKRNRMPYFFTCFENAFSFSLEELVYLRTDNPLFPDYSLFDVVDHLRGTYQQQYYNGETRLDYREWLQTILDHLEQRKEPKQRNNRTSREY